MLQAIPSRHRSLVLLGGVLLIQVLMLAVQIRREGEVRLVRVWAVTLITPFQRAGWWVVDSVRDTWNNYVGLRGTHAENAQLREEVAQLKLRANTLEGRAAEAERLAALLQIRELHADTPMIAARVFGASADGKSRTVYLDRGADHGVRKNMAVITPDGVVGKVLAVSGKTAEVLLITDEESGVGALLESTRTQGVANGTGKAVLSLDYVITSVTVTPGERILTSGQDLIYPKDLPVGKVIDAAEGSPFKIIRVEPAAHLDRLEEVLILLSTAQELAPKKTESTAARKEPKPAAVPPALPR